MFNGKKATVLQATSTRLTALIPADATSGYITVTVNKNTAQSPATFCVRPLPPVISATGLNSPPVVLSSNVSGIQWFVNGFAIAGATSQTYTATQDGIYTAKVVGGSCDSQASNPIPVVITGIESTSAMSGNLVIYPNPATDRVALVIEGDVSADNTEVQIFNAVGLKKESLRFDNGSRKEISLSGYSDGLYFVRIHHSGKVVTERLVKVSN
jgi:hypothetical protein